MLYRTKVVRCERSGDLYTVELEKCEFYPDGAGGQLGDRGKVGEANVVEVIKGDEKVKLMVDRRLNEKEEYLVEIFEGRRFDISQQHTAQHILSRAFEDLFEFHTVGFHMGESVSTIDLDTPTIDWSIVKRAENLSNDVVWRDMPVDIIFEDPDKIEKYNLRKISEKVKNLEKVRLIKIGNFDICACGGFHVKSTGQVGLVKVIHFEKVKGKYIRLEYVAGSRALNYIRTLEERERRLFEITKASKDDLITKVQKLLSDSKTQKKKLSYLVDDLKDRVLKELEDNYTAAGNVNMYSYIGTTELIETLASTFQKKKNSVFVGFDIFRNSVVITSNDENSSADELARRVLENFQGKGGGSKKRANVVLQKELTPENIEKIKADVVNYPRLKSEA